MAERAGQDTVQAICEPIALVPGFDGTGVRVLMDAHSHAVAVRLRDLQRLLAAMAAELRELRGRYGKDGEVWCGARRDQAGSAYCVEMAGHERDGVGHMWSQPYQDALARWEADQATDRPDPAAGRAAPEGAAMTSDRKTAAAHRVLLGALAIRETFELGPLRFRALAGMVAQILDADTVASLLSEWEALGFVTGASSLQNGLPEPVYKITEVGKARWDRMRGQT